MVLDSFLKYSSDGEPQGFEAGRRSFDASASYDFDALGRARQAERERLERGEFSGALRDMVESGEAGVRMRAGDWYLESTVGGVCMWLRACGDNPSEDQKTFLSAERINRLLADAAVPDTVSDAGSATPKAGTTEKSAKSPEAVEAERKAGVLADLLVANPFIEKFYRFGDYVAPDANTFRSVVRDGNLAYAERPHRSELVGEIRAVWPDYVDPHARLHETKREKLPSGEMVGDTVSHLDSLIARYERMPGNHGRTTELLMGLRLGLSQDADVPAIGLQDGESLRRAVDIVDYLQDPEGYTGKVPDLWSAPGDMVNLLRYGTSFGMQETVAIVRDHTSGLLHKL